MPQPLSRDEQWDRLRHWLEESIASVRRENLERLPATFSGPRGEAAITAYETCLEAMTFLENWDKYGLEPVGDAQQGPTG